MVVPELACLGGANASVGFFTQSRGRIPMSQASERAFEAYIEEVLLIRGGWGIRTNT